MLLHGDGSVSVWAPPPAAYGTEVGPDDLMGALESAAGGPFKAVDVACGRYASFVLQSDGTVWSWGSTDCLDELDQCDTRLGWAPGGGESETPAQVMGLTDVIQLSAGGGFTLALQADGKVIGWGNNEYNQLGIGQPDFATPGNIVEAAIKALRDGHHGYTPANGILPLRQAVGAQPPPPHI